MRGKISGFMVPVAIDAKIVDVADGKAWLHGHSQADVFVVDLASGIELARRSFAGARWPSVEGAFVLFDTDEGKLVARADLGGETRVLLCPKGSTILGAHDGVVVVRVESRVVEPNAVHFFWARVGFDLATGRELYRVDDREIRWFSGDAKRNVLIGVRGRTREIVALRVADGTIAWTAAPFAQPEERVNDVVGVSLAVPGEAHVRAETFGKEGPGQLLVRLDIRTGEVLSTRRSGAATAPWLGDPGPATEAAAMAAGSRAFSWRDGAVVETKTALVIVRPSNGGATTQRVALPLLREAGLRGDLWVGRAEIGERSELVVLPLPDAAQPDELDLELVPRGDVQMAPAGDEAIVTFSSPTAAFIVVQHPVHGRATLTRKPDQPVPAKDARVLLEGVTVKPGPVVKAERWSLAGTTAQRECATFLLPAQLEARSAGKAAPSDVIASLFARAGAANVQVSDEVLRVFTLIQADPVFRQALADCGMHFEDDRLCLDILEEAADDRPALADIFPLWGNGYGDGVGGLVISSASPSFVRVDLSDDVTTPIGATFVAAIRRVLGDLDDREATRAYLEERLSGL